MTTTQHPVLRLPRKPRGRSILAALATLGLTASLIGLQAPLGAAAAPPRAGVDYVGLAHPVSASPREVVEVFWYDCPHSYQLQQPLMEWAARQKPAVTIRQIPAVWSDKPEMVAYARLFYALDSLGLAARTDMSVFHAVRDLHEDLTDESEIRDWSDQQGLDTEQLIAAWNSSKVQQEVRDAPALRERYEVQEEPSVVVGGRYRTSPFLAPGGVNGTVPVVDYLLQHSTAQAAAAAAPAKTRPVKANPPKKAPAKKTPARRPTAVRAAAVQAAAVKRNA